MSFSNLGLSTNILNALSARGYQEATPIQAQAIPVILEGRDIIASAQTGTGKTAAFALPIIMRLAQHGKCRVLVLVPTRELALQVGAAFKEYGQFTNLNTSVICGGMPFGPQLKKIRNGVDMIVATPGRLLDHIQQKTIHLDHIETVVLDEVDRMLDMGFLPDVQRLVNLCKNRTQTLLFSATIPPAIEHLSRWALKDPVSISIGRRQAPAETIHHVFYPVSTSQKLELLLALLDKINFENAIVFTRTKMEADKIAAHLRHLRKPVAVLHSDRSQSQRIRALAGFKEGEFTILVATDIAARGLDIVGVGHVINYNIPDNPEDYVHRIGRTGRANTSGEAFTLVTGENIPAMRAIERFVNADIPKEKLEDFNYAYTNLFDVLSGDYKASSSRHRSRGRRRIRR